ncbi:MAG: isopentenyl transferase family protein, partial [Bacillota bacterium]
MKPLLVILGPTAVGKTAVGIQLCRKIAGEIVSGDSMLVYREMDIGTAKPSRAEQQGIPHYMIDIVEP